VLSDGEDWPRMEQLQSRKSQLELFFANAYCLVVLLALLTGLFTNLFVCFVYH
jgi:hypothetical protein